MNSKPKEVTWVSANAVVEAQTKAIEKLWKSSRPRPSNRRMGFKGEPKRNPLAEL